MKKYLFILLVLALGGFTHAKEATAPKTAGSNKPNIIFILSDDLGADILSCFGSDQYKTPTWMLWRQGESSSPTRMLRHFVVLRGR